MLSRRYLVLASRGGRAGFSVVVGGVDSSLIGLRRFVHWRLGDSILHLAIEQQVCCTDFVAICLNQSASRQRAVKTKVE